jgi:hypothetical protein
MNPEVGPGDREGKLDKLSGLQQELRRALEALDNEAPNNVDEDWQLRADISKMQEEIDVLKKELGVEA